MSAYDDPKRTTLCRPGLSKSLWRQGNVGFAHC
jgi:hypothetical protein